MQGAQEGRRRQHRVDRAGDPGGGRAGRDHGRLRDRHRVTPASPAATCAASTSTASPRSPTREVSAADVQRVLEQRKAIPLPSDRQVIHVLPQEYIVDDQDGIREPIGMSGVRLEARVHLVTAATASVQNVIKCAERCDLHVADVVLEPLASAEAVLSRRREGDRRRADRHRRRHHRRDRLRGRRHRAHQRDPDRRHQHHQRHRRRPAHADRRGRAHQDQVRLRQPGAWSTTTRRSRCPRSAAAARARCRASVLAEHHRAARRRDLPARCATCSTETGYIDMLPRAWCSPAARRCSRACTELAEEVLGMPVRRGAAHGRRRPRRRGQEPGVRDRRRPREVRRGRSCASAPMRDRRAADAARRCRGTDQRGSWCAHRTSWFREVF